MTKKAFTLIELLVVIAIIAILMSVMIPALNKARNRGRVAVCMSNVRSLTYAATLYLADNDSWFPTRNMGEDNRWNTRHDSYWDDKLFVYIEDYDVFSCPITISEFRESVRNIQSDLRGVEKWKHPKTYRFNSWLEGWGGPGSSRPWPDSHGDSTQPKPFSVNQVRHTADVVMFADGSGVGGGMDGVRRFSYFYSGGLRFMPDIMPAHEIRLLNTGRIIDFHQVPECSGGVNLGFVDGSIQNISRFEYTVESVNHRRPPREGLRVNPTGPEL